MPLLAPSGALLELAASTPAVGLNGSAEITAYLTEGLSGGDRGGGSPVQNGTVVSFTTNLGRIEPAEAKTSNGRVTVRLVADGRSGTAVVKAFSGGALDADGVTAQISIPIGAAAARRISITASPQSLPATGGTATISARVEDEVGNPLPGIPVTFSTTRGTLSATSASSGSNGLATTTLSTNQEAVVTATSGGGGGTAEAPAAVTGQITVTVRPRVLVNISFSGSAIVGVPMTFTLTPANANAVLTSVEVDFGDGTSADLGAMVAATTIAHPFRTSGIKTVTVEARDSEGTIGESSTQVAVAPLTLTLSASPASPTVGSVVSFTAIPAAGAIVDRYEWNFGDGTAVATTNNQAVYVYKAVGTFVASVRAIPIGNGTPATALVTVDVRP